jgi:hypothetical protein
MGTRITVTLKGPLGLDDVDLLLAELEKETRIDWYREDHLDDRHLIGGFLEIVLVAVTSKTVEMAYGQTLDKAREAATKVREIVERWRATHLDPPDAAVETEQADDSGNADSPESGAGTEPES